MGFEDWFLCGCPNTTSSTEDVELLQDYSKKPTPLFKAIENQKWASVNYFIKTGYWKNNFFPDSVGPQMQAKTWVVRYDEITFNEEPTSKTTNICVPQKRQDRISWKQLPIHAAIIYNAPAIIIQKLINLYPNALKCTDSKGNLPIHLAFRHVSNDAVLALLLQEYPEGMNVRESKGLLPTECATELGTQQPLRGALLKTSMPRDEQERNHYIQQKVKEERVYFDERAPTPHMGNGTRTTPSSSNSQEKSQLQALTQQMESLKTSVDRAISHNASLASLSSPTAATPANAASASATNSTLEAFIEKEKEQPEGMTPRRVGSKEPLSPSSLQSLQDLVSKALAGPSILAALSPGQEDKITDSDVPVKVIQSPTNGEHDLSMVNSLLESPRSPRAIPTQPTSNSNILNAFSQPPSHLALPPLMRNLSYNSMQQQHQMQQQKLQQLQELKEEASESVRHTATFEEQQRALDQEVREMEEKMHQMEMAMKEMHLREKTVRRELALTLQEVKHWKEQAKRAATEEEKNRILTEMLHELVPAGVTPRKHNKTPAASTSTSMSSGSDISDDRQRQKKRIDPDEQKTEKHYKPSSMRKTQSDLHGQRRSRSSRRLDDEARDPYRSSSRDRDDDVRARDYPPPSSKRHSDAGVYSQTSFEDQYDHSRRPKGHSSKRHNDAPPEIPLRRIHSEHHQGRRRPPEAYDDEGVDSIELTPDYRSHGRHNPQSARGPGREDRRYYEATPNPRYDRVGTGYNDPQGPHVDSDSFVPPNKRQPQEDESADFSESLVDKIAALQVKQQNEKYRTKSHKRAERIVKQRRQGGAQENGVWQPREPEDSKHMNHYRRAKQHTYRMMNSSPGTAASASMSSPEYY